MSAKGRKTSTSSAGYMTGIASEYLVLSILYRLGMDAYMSVGNRKSIDIRVVRATGEAISIDVKSVQGYSSLIVNNVRPRENHIIVFVIYKNRFRDVRTFPDIYVVPSVELPKLTSNYSREKRILKGSIAPYQNQWDLVK